MKKVTTVVPEPTRRGRGKTDGEEGATKTQNIIPKKYFDYFQYFVFLEIGPGLPRPLLLRSPEANCSRDMSRCRLFS